MSYVTAKKACRHRFAEVFRFASDRTSVHFIFATLTVRQAAYSIPALHELSKEGSNAYHTWSVSVRKALSKFAHGNKLEYIRSIELQERGSPHIHAILATTKQFRCPMCDNENIVQDVYDRLQSLWHLGLAKFTAMYPIRSQGLSYVLKYVGKGASVKTAWSHVYRQAESLDDFARSRGFEQPHIYQHSSTLERTSDQEIPVRFQEDSVHISRQPPRVWLNSDLNKGRLKLLTYTRKFPFVFFLNRNTNMETLSKLYDAWLDAGCPMKDDFTPLTMAQWNYIKQCNQAPLIDLGCSDLINNQFQFISA